jgi:hypothetical protein
MLLARLGHKAPRATCRGCNNGVFLLEAAKETDEKVDDARERVGTMEAAGTTYFTGRAASIKDIQNTELRDQAQLRLDANQNEYANILASLREAGQSLQTLRTDLNNQITYLGSDLTPSALRGALWPVFAAPQGTGDSLSLTSDAQIREILAERVDVQRRNVGIVVGIVTPGGRRIIPYGRFSHDESRALTGDTVFEIGSVTKVFTSALLADMARRGEVKLTDPVAKYLPATVTIGSNNGRTITLADLATHTSGLPFWPSNRSSDPRRGALDGHLLARSRNS